MNVKIHEFLSGIEGGFETYIATQEFLCDSINSFNKLNVYIKKITVMSKHDSMELTNLDPVNIPIYRDIYHFGFAFSPWVVPRIMYHSILYLGYSLFGRLWKHEDN